MFESEGAFRAERAAGEAVLLVTASFAILTPLVLTLDPGPARWPSTYLPAAVLSLLLVAFFWWSRWRRVIRVDERGIELCRSPRRVLARLDWGDIDELFLLGPREFEVRGLGRRIRYTRLYEGESQARAFCLPRLDGIRAQLQARALRDGRIVFRMPTGTWKAHLAYLGALLVLTALTGWCLAPLFTRGFFGFPLVVVLFGSGWLWSLRKRASRMGTRVTLDREGLVVRRLDGRDRVAWRDFHRSEWNEAGGLDLVLRSRRVLTLPPSLGNLALLEEFLQAGPPPSDSHTPGEAEGRTMMQSP